MVAAAWRRLPVSVSLLLILAIAGCGSEPQLPVELDEQPLSATDLLAEGLAALELGQHDLAQQNLEAALALDPELVGALAGLAQIHSARQEFQQAWQLWERVQELDRSFFDSRAAMAIEALCHWAVQVEEAQTATAARQLYALAYQVETEAGVVHACSLDLHLRLADYWLEPAELADPLQALEHLYLASRAAPARTDVLSQIAVVAMLADRPEESLWALEHARSLGGDHAGDLDEASRQELASMYVLRAADLIVGAVEPPDPDGQGYRAGDHSRYLMAAQRLAGPTAQLSFWMSLSRLAAADVSGAAQNLRLVQELVQAPDWEDVDWWDTHRGATEWLLDLVGRGPVPPPVSGLKQLPATSRSGFSPATAWSPGRPTLAFSAADGVYVSDAGAESRRVFEPEPGVLVAGPLAWHGEDALLVALQVAGLDDDGVDEVPAGNRLLVVDPASGAAEVLWESEGSDTLKHLALHPASGDIALVLAASGGETDPDGNAYTVLVLGRAGDERASFERPGIAEALSWQPLGHSLSIVERAGPHRPTTTVDLRVSGGEARIRPGVGAAHHTLGAEVWSSALVPTTRLDLFPAEQQESRPLLLEFPLAAETVSAWAVDGSHLALEVRAGAGYGVPHTLVLDLEGEVQGWMHVAHGAAWSECGSYFSWMTLDQSGNHRIMVGVWTPAISVPDHGPGSEQWRP